MATLFVCGVTFAIAWFIYESARSTTKTVLAILGLTVFVHVVGPHLSHPDHDYGSYDEEYEDRAETAEQANARLLFHMLVYGLSAYAATIVYQMRHHSKAKSEP